MVAPGWDPNLVRQQNGSNMSLNMPQSYFHPQTSTRDMPPPAWINAWGAPNMYPYPVGMVPMINPGIHFQPKKTCCY